MRRRGLNGSGFTKIVSVGGGFAPTRAEVVPGDEILVVKGLGAGKRGILLYQKRGVYRVLSEGREFSLARYEFVKARKLTTGESCEKVDSRESEERNGPKTYI